MLTVEIVRYVYETDHAPHVEYGCPTFGMRETCKATLLARVSATRDQLRAVGLDTDLVERTRRIPFPEAF